MDESMMIKFLAGSDKVVNKKIWVLGGDTGTTQTLKRAGCNVLDYNPNSAVSGIIASDICVMPPRNLVTEATAIEQEILAKSWASHPHILQMELNEFMERLNLQNERGYVTYVEHDIAWAKSKKIFVFAGRKIVKDALAKAGYNVLNCDDRTEYPDGELLYHVEGADIICIGSEKMYWWQHMTSQHNMLTAQIWDNKFVEADLTETIKMIAGISDISIYAQGIRIEQQHFGSIEDFCTSAIYTIERQENPSLGLDSLLGASSKM